jgi:hypothetical protein
MKQALLFATAFLLFFSCVETDYKNDRTDPKIFISNPLLELKKGGVEYPYEIDYFNYVGKQVENPKISWTSSDPAVLEITEDGLATGIDFGTATVKATLITSEETLTIISNDEVIVSTATLKESLEFVGEITSTTSYLLKGSYSLVALDDGGVKLSLGEDYEADTNLPGLYVYLGNNPKSIADAHEIGPVTVFQGAHFYDLPTIDIYDYNYILYWCKPFGVKVGEGQIK